MVHLYTPAQSPPVGLPVPDVYFSLGYGLACLDADSDDWLLIESFDGRWQVPLIVRPTTFGKSDAISPYGYSGIYAAPSLSDRDLTQAWTRTLDTLGRLGVVSVLLRHSPVVPQPPPLPTQTCVVKDHPTLVADLGPSATMWEQLEGRCRTAVRKAQRDGLCASVRPANTDDARPSSDFRVLYDLTMQRRDAKETYFFPDRYFERLVVGLGENLWVAETRDAEGSVLASALLMRHDSILHYHLSGSTPEGARRGANNLMLWHVMEYASRSGVARLHLGGGLAAGDSLQKFKQSFGGRELRYSASGIVIDRRSYESATCRRAMELGINTTDLDRLNFFPAYRNGE